MRRVIIRQLFLTFVYNVCTASVRKFQNKVLQTALKPQVNTEATFRKWLTKSHVVKYRTGLTNITSYLQLNVVVFLNRLSAHLRVSYNSVKVRNVFNHINQPESFIFVKNNWQIKTLKNFKHQTDNRALLFSLDSLFSGFTVFKSGVFTDLPQRIQQVSRQLMSLPHHLVTNQIASWGGEKSSPSVDWQAKKPIRLESVINRVQSLRAKNTFNLIPPSPTKLQPISSL